MSKLKTVIVDDEIEARNGLKHSLRPDSELDIMGVCANGIEAIELIQSQKTDLLLLDIQMPEINGFEVLLNIDPEKMPMVIFITAFDEYAIKAFNYHALDYLLKPYTEARLQEAIAIAKGRHIEQSYGSQVKELLRELESTREKRHDSIIGSGITAFQNAGRVAVRSNGSVHFFNLPDVLYFEAYDAYVKIHLANGQVHVVNNSLKALEQFCEPSQFVRIHRSFVVNINTIEKVSSGFSGDFVATLIDGTELKGSRNYRGSIEKFLLGKGK